MIIEIRAANLSRQTVVVTAWTAILTLLVLCPIAALAGTGLLGRRILLVSAVLSLLICGVAAVRVAATVGPRGGAWLCILGTGGAFVSLGYLWSISDVPTAIPIGGVGGLLLSLTVIGAGSTQCFAQV